MAAAVRLRESVFHFDIMPQPRLRRGRRSTLFNYSGARQRDRLARQGAELLQRLSHKPGTVQPRHIFA